MWYRPRLVLAWSSRSPAISRGRSSLGARIWARVRLD
eukprot:CAMPEP_0118811148 /NCGR_PEP_ID=MMETSP1162-20130426/1467_1 /TAXON_ID=33656 /ORGANISM="Phaeocystis Sp, Strain CCMP2710" /LENGTH=36 /DNA_ID= /DNA_START= /DNA_END= /DNA_ORIENTATION=